MKRSRVIRLIVLSVGIVRPSDDLDDLRSIEVCSIGETKRVSWIFVSPCKIRWIVRRLCVDPKSLAVFQRERNDCSANALSGAERKYASSSGCVHVPCSRMEFLQGSESSSVG
jgi:hypothetical protein